MTKKNIALAELLRTLEVERAMRRQAEAAITASEARYRALFDEAVDGIMLMTEDGTELMVNATFARMHGYDSPEEMQSLQLKDLDTPESARMAPERIRGAVEGKAPTFEVEHYRKDGSIIPLSVTGSRIDLDGRRYLLTFHRDISEQKRAEQKTRDILIFQRTLLETIPSPIFFKDTEGRYLGCNRAFENLVGLTKKELVGKSVYDLYPAPAADRYHEMDVLLLSRRQRQEYESTVVHEDGTVRSVVFDKDVFRNADGSVAGIIGVVHDITERKQVEEKLQASEERFKAIFDGATDGIILADPESRQFKLCNEAMCRMTGYGPDELSSLGLADLHPPEELATIVDGFDKQYRGEIKVAANVPILRKDGSLFHADIGTVQIPIDRVTYLAGFFRDVTERKQTEERLRKLNELQSALHDPGSLVQKLKRITDTVVEIFAADFARIWLVGRGDLCSKGCMHAEATEGPHVCRERDKCLQLSASSGRYTHLDGRGHGRVPFGCYKIGRVAAGLELSFLTNDVTNDPRVHDHAWAKDLGLVSFAGYRLRPPNGDTIGVMALFSRHPISPGEDALLKSIGNLIVPVIQSARAEELLRASEEKYRGIFDESVAAIYVFDVNKRFIDTNQAGLDLLGYTREELLRLDIADVDADPDVVLPAHSELLSGGRLINFEHRLRRKDDSIITVLNNSRALTGPDGTVIGIQSTLFNITLRKQLEMDLEARNEELVRFVYTVSHDLKSPLVTIQTFLGFLEKDLAGQDAERVQADIGYIERAAKKMLDLLEELLELSRIGRKMNSPEDVPFEEVVQSALDTVAGQIAERRVKISMARVPLLLHGDRPRLTEVFQNLVDNAVKFMGDQVAPHIEIGVETIDAEPVFYVRDNGLGIDPRHQDKLFGLFEKLHPGTPGTGIGLALVKRIIEVHGGRIWVESAGTGQGSTFRFTLQGTQPC